MQRTSASIRYAKALFLLALENNSSKDVLLDLKSVLEIIHTDNQLVNFINNPTIRSSVKVQLFKKLFTKKIKPITMNFLSLVINKGREVFLSDIINKYEAIFNKHNNISVVQVISSEPLSDSLKQSIKEKVSFNGGEVKLKEKINKSLLGGFIIKRGDLQYDASIKKKLSNAKRAFKL
ncbi:MAG: ATP synthase F1 subunit delta [Flavobacteriales bacterium]|jgi:F-type H+-transporting ATPase subunit delta|nr:ATP synthase F1 subunit delta [Flavobacteriales bacterium]|tara:strand:- start:494 stop:1027 length:534 start_codon:yes stop_codon:yes gene_type:complete